MDYPGVLLSDAVLPLFDTGTDLDVIIDQILGWSDHLNTQMAKVYAGSLYDL